MSLLVLSVVLITHTPQRVTSVVPPSAEWKAPTVDGSYVIAKSVGHFAISSRSHGPSTSSSSSSVRFFRRTMYFDLYLLLEISYIPLPIWCPRMVKNVDDVFQFFFQLL